VRVCVENTVCVWCARSDMTLYSIRACHNERVQVCVCTYTLNCNTVY